MSESDWPDEHAHLRPSPFEKEMGKRFDEVLRDIQSLALEIEEQRWWRWGCFVLLLWIAWRVK